MKGKDLVSVMFALLLALLSVSTVWASDNKELEQAKAWFRAGKIDEAHELLQRLVSTSTLSKGDRVEAFEFMAFCNLAQQREELVRTNFSQILAIDASYEPKEAYLGHPAVMRAWLTARKDVMKNYAMMPGQAGIKTIAVLDFDNNSFEDQEKYDNLGKALSDILISDLKNLTELKVVERERIQFVLDEIERSEAVVGGKALVNPQYAVRVGHLLGAQSVLLGSFMKIDHKLRLDVRLVHTETSEIIKTDYVEGKDDQILDLAKRLALKVSENLDVAIDKVEEQQDIQIENRAEIPLDAAMAYSEALNYLDLERYDKAREMLTKALDIAPSFRMAKSKLELLHKFNRS